ncbi:high mobility group protein-like protein [Chloriridovirus anopheles1]|uniref:High mobility group protein-like protein n=1 Tax=Chloriridovirus anopheles1 TaxID=1465751 RepID=W8QRK5_9VIRU|nr:high mobility group protein-like protein [Anopheles minimus iridovirus]AHL67627.1 high mobility group protein-like protein [Anopheles minimus iridovirus]
MFFCQDMRQKIVADNEGCKPHEIMSLLGSKWRELTTKQKSKYYEQAAEDKERYLDMKEIEKRRSKTPSKLSSYFLFCEDERPKVKKDHPDFSTKEVTAECGKRWNELKLNDQKKYNYYVEKAAK